FFMSSEKLQAGLSLRLSLLLFLALPLVVILFGAGYHSLQRLEQEIERRMQEDLELIARAIRGPLEYSLEHNRAGSVQQALDSLFRLKRVYGAYVYDSLGERTATSGAQEPEMGSGQLVKLAAEGDRLGEYQQTESTQVYSYFVPLTDSVGRNIGLLQLTREGRDFNDYIQRVRYQALIFLCLLSLLLLSVLLYGHHRIIGRNLRRLLKSMARIENGERQHRARASGPREMCQLSGGMNAMLDSLARSERALERQTRERDRLRNQLLQSQKMAAIGQLAAGVAHELGAPMSVVSGKAQRLLRNQDLSAAARQSLQEILEEVGRTEQIVHQLLDFGRQNPLHKKMLPMDRMMAVAVSQLEPLLNKKPVTLKNTGVQPAPCLKVDQVRIEQALVNLLMNAVQAVENNGLVEYGWFRHETAVGFYVADNGPGIQKDLRSRLFEPFFTTKTVGEGTGLGLAVAQAAAQDHDGELEVDQSDLGGALFTMTFYHCDTEEGGGAHHDKR
ncbi:MAG: ATP-binding protein, partial [Pelovirga sp.]